MEVQMGMTSLQAGMDSWFQSNMQEDNTGIIDSCSSPADASGEDVMLAACTPRSLIERRLRPPHEQSLKCPRCESTHTKFCYYNNYSLSQPRYFCKTCRRYWTKGGTLRNIPVGGGCRKNKKQSTSSNKNNDSSSTSALTNNHQNGTGSLMSPPPPASYDNHIHHGDQTHLQLAFPEQIHFSSLHTNFFPENNQNTPMDHELALSDHFMGNIGTGENFCGLMNNSSNNYFNGVNCSPYGLLEYDHLGNSSNTTSGINILESCQRIKGPHDHISYHHHQNHAETQDVKPNGKILSLEWHHLNHHQQQQQQQQACISGAAEKQSSFGYSFGGLGSWNGLMNGYGSSASNPLV